MSEILLEKLLEVFLQLPFDTFERDAVRTFWINGFADVDLLVREHFSALRGNEIYREFPKLLEDACRITDKLINVYVNLENLGIGENENEVRDDTEASTLESDSSRSSKTTSTGPWSILAKNNISQQSVLAFLFVFLQSECSSEISMSDKQLCLLSARLYLNLLCLPGCNAFGIFQDPIFLNSINCMRTKETKDSGKKSSEHGKGKNRGKSKRARRSSVDLEDDEILSSPTNNNINDKNSEIPAALLNKLISNVLVSLENVVKAVPLKHLGIVVEKLIDLSCLETELIPTISDLICDSRGSNAHQGNISCLAYKVLIALCNPVHGNMHKTFCTVFSHLIPCIVMSGAGSAQTIPRQIVTIRDKATELVQFLIQKFTPDVLPAARILIQHASTKVADRAEFRTKVSQSMVVLINCLPIKERAQMIEWFHRLCKNPKAGHRMFTLEIFHALLLEPECSDPDLAPETLELVSYKGLLKSIIEEMEDKSPVVSAKAMALLSSSQTISKQLLENSNGKTDLKTFLGLIQNSCNHEKSTVRRAAILLLEVIICQDINCVTKQYLETVCEHAQDVNISVQKQSSISINKVLETYPDSDLAQNTWLEAQLPLVYADESSVQEKAIDLMEKIFLHQLLKDTELVWLMLKKVSCGSFKDKQQNLRRVFTSWFKAKKTKPQDFLKVVKNRMNGCYRNTAWMIMSFLTLGQKLPNLNFVVDACLEEMNLESPDVAVLQRILQVVSQVAEYLPQTQLEQLLRDLQHNCRLFKFPVQVISFAFQAIEKILIAIHDQSASEMKSQWCVSMSQEIDKVFSKSVILENGFSLSTLEEEENFICIIITVGEVFQLCPWLLPAKFKLVIHSLVGSPTVPQEFFQPNAFPFSSPLQPGSITAKIKAHVIITFGKICIGDREFCKSSLLTAIKELQESSEPSIRNNLALALTDLLVFHSTLVEPYIPNVTACLRDSSQLVRRQTLIALARLLKEDYIKWKGTLFYRVLMCCIDESSEIRKMAEYCLLQLLLKRNPHAFSHHFVECVYFFNAFTENENFNQFPNEKAVNSRLFSLKDNSEKRYTLYKFLLHHMPSQECFRLHGQICQDILTPLLNENFALDERSSNLIKDALHILSSEEIKLSPLGGVHEEEEDEEAAVVTDAKKTIITLIRKQAVQAVVPIIISLKQFFEKANSPLLGDLESFLREFLKDFKNELKDILGEDKQLASEIEFIFKIASTADKPVLE